LFSPVHAGGGEEPATQELDFLVDNQALCAMRLIDWSIKDGKLPVHSRDEQEFERRRQQIIGGALAVFSGKGFEKARERAAEV
jgi:hypothetical protein